MFAGNDSGFAHASLFTHAGALRPPADPQPVPLSHQILGPSSPFGTSQDYITPTFVATNPVAAVVAPPQATVVTIPSFTSVFDNQTVYAQPQPTLSQQDLAFWLNNNS
ncbi:MAG: hypothetical protein KC462_04875, partial [Cyanobacteria bacterium HKST-UBA05]|nr:hypothetical protein [Cyanobacteria bacterium HKST-UBA05]